MTVIDTTFPNVLMAHFPSRPGAQRTDPDGGQVLGSLAAIFCRVVKSVSPKIDRIVSECAWSLPADFQVLYGTRAVAVFAFQSSTCSVECQKKM